MQLKVTKKSKLRDFIGFINLFPTVLPEMRKQYPKKITGFDFFTLTIKELLEAMQGKYPKRLTKGRIGYNAKVIKYLELINSFYSGIEILNEKIQETTPVMDIKSTAAAAALLEYSPEEAILLSVRDFYGIHNLENCQQLTLYEYIIARKAKYNEITYQQQLSKQYQ